MDSSSSGSGSDSDDKDDNELKELLAHAQERVSRLARSVHTIVVCTMVVVTTWLNYSCVLCVTHAVSRWKLAHISMTSTWSWYACFALPGTLTAPGKPGTKWRRSSPCRKVRSRDSAIPARDCSLPAELWLEWLGDELPLAAMTAEACEELVELFERAIKDYLCKFV